MYISIKIEATVSEVAAPLTAWFLDQEYWQGLCDFLENENWNVILTGHVYSQAVNIFLKISINANLGLGMNIEVQSMRSQEPGIAMNKHQCTETRFS